MIRPRTRVGGDIERAQIEFENAAPTWELLLYRSKIERLKEVLKRHLIPAIHADQVGLTCRKQH